MWALFFFYFVGYLLFTHEHTKKPLHNNIYSLTLITYDTFLDLGRGPSWS